MKKIQDCKSWESGSIFPGWMVFYCKGKYKNMKHCNDYISLMFWATFHPLNWPHWSIIEVCTPGPRYPFVKLSKLKLDHDHHRGLYSAHHDLQIPSGIQTTMEHVQFIVNCPMKNGGSVHRFLYAFQRLSTVSPPVFAGGSYCFFGGFHPSWHIVGC